MARADVINIFTARRSLFQHERTKLQRQLLNLADLGLEEFDEFLLEANVPSTLKLVFPS
jgi:hypothetical protein